MERSKIRISRNKLFIGSRQHGEVVDSSFQQSPLVSDFVTPMLDPINTRSGAEDMHLSSQEDSLTQEDSSVVNAVLGSINSLVMM